MYCPKCGHNNRPNASYCAECGFPLHELKEGRDKGTGNQAAAADAQPEADRTQVRQPLVEPASVIPLHPVASPEGYRPSAPKKRHWPYVVAGIAAAAVIGAGAFCLTGGMDHLLNGTASSETQSADAASSTDASSEGSQEETTAPVMGNTSSNYAGGAMTASGGAYDYFFSAKEGGLCRTSDGTGIQTVVALPAQSDLASDTFSWLNLDGDRIYYLWLASTGKGNSYSIHSAAVDGSGDSTIYSAPEGNEGSTEEYRALFLVDHKLYVVGVPRSGSELSNVTYTVHQLDEDGNEQSSWTFAASSQARLSTDGSRLWYTNYPNGADATAFEIMSENLDGTDNRLIYTGTGWTADAPLIADGKLYCTEYASGTQTLSSMEPDGTGKQALYSASAASKDACARLAAVAQGNVYLVASNSDTTPQAIIVPTAGGASSTATLPFTGKYLALTTGSDHLLLTGGYTGVPYVTGENVATMDYSCTQIAQLAGSKAAASSSASSDVPVAYDSSTGQITISQYGFKATLPQGLTSSVNADKTGLILKQDSSGTQISVWAKPNTDGTTIDAAQAAAAAGHTLDYSAGGKNGWFVVSYWDGDTGHYLREYVDSDRIFALDFTWPRGNDASNQIVEDMTASIEMS